MDFVSRAGGQEEKMVYGRTVGTQRDGKNRKDALNETQKPVMVPQYPVPWFCDPRLGLF